METVYESTPQSVLQVVFILSNYKNSHYNVDTNVFLISITFSFLSMTSSIISQDMSKMVNKKWKSYKKKMFPPSFQLIKHVFIRLVEITHRVLILSLFWYVFGNIIFLCVISFELIVIECISSFYSKPSLYNFLTTLNFFVLFPSDLVYDTHGSRLFSLIVDHNSDSDLDDSTQCLAAIFVFLCSICLYVIYFGIFINNEAMIILGLCYLFLFSPWFVTVVMRKHFIEIFHMMNKAFDCSSTCLFYSVGGFVLAAMSLVCYAVFFHALPFRLMTILITCCCGCYLCKMDEFKHNDESINIFGSLACNMRICLSIVELMAVIVAGLRSYNGVNGNPHFNSVFASNFHVIVTIVTMILFLTYTQYSLYFPNFRLPFSIGVRSVWGLAYAGKLDELLRLMRSRHGNDIKLEHWCEEYSIIRPASRINHKNASVKAKAHLKYNNTLISPFMLALANEKFDVVDHVCNTYDYYPGEMLFPEPISPLFAYAKTPTRLQLKKFKQTLAVLCWNEENNVIWMKDRHDFNMKWNPADYVAYKIYCLKKYQKKQNNINHQNNQDNHSGDEIEFLARSISCDPSFIRIVRIQ